MDDEMFVSSLTQKSKLKEPDFTKEPYASLSEEAKVNLMRVYLTEANKPWDSRLE